MECAESGCFKVATRRGLCKTHYNRALANGLPRVGTEPGSSFKFVESVIASSTDDCILWPYQKTDQGYGRIFIDRVKHLAHRYVCEAVNGPSDLFACHKCGNRACVNPRHLKWGTPLENMMDRKTHGTHLEGENTPAAKLNAEQVSKIKTRLSQPMRRGDLTAIAKEFGVHKCTIQDIAAGRSWASVNA